MEYGLAIQTLDRIIELHEGTSQLYLNKALCEYRIGEINDATSSLQTSLELDPNNQDSETFLQKLKDRLQQLRNYSMMVYG
jgi:Tfp pilus assembly protein PilF